MILVEASPGEGRNLGWSQRTHLKKRKQSLKGKEPIKEVDALQTTPQQMRDWQQTDPTLRKVRELTSSQTPDIGQGRATFFYRRGLIYRKWSPQSGANRDTLSRDQLVLPQQCRSVVLSITHDMPMAGHLCTNKSKGRILNCYYWPGIFRDVANYCKTCEVCQKAQGQRHLRQAKMIAMPSLTIRSSVSPWMRSDPSPRVSQGTRIS